MAVYLADEQELEVAHEDLVELAHFVLAERRVPAEMELALLLVDEATIAGLNAEHLSNEGPTDVLAFPIDEPGESAPGGPSVLGDVVLCPAYVARQAAEHGVTLGAELRMLTVHGILHLLGMDHAEPEEERVMTALTGGLLEAFERRHR
ncbi:MAG: hypothetical protein RLZZ272_17 [Actinomycetota bacterium]|jgi:probable rRNA maturation factor